MLQSYEWIVVLGSFMAAFAAFGIGANDVANAFGTSVGSKAITLTQAVIIASIFEMGGAVLLGAHVTDTVLKKIVDIETFRGKPELLMYGMMCVLFATGVWLLVASYLELPVSTTHSVIGGIIGMSLAAKGGGAINWSRYEGGREGLKKYTGMAPVLISWVVSPFISAGAAVLLFWFVRTLVLRRRNSLQRCLQFFPGLVGVTVAINTYFIIFQGFRNTCLDDCGNDKGKKLSAVLGPGYASLIAWGLGTVTATLLWYGFIPWLKKRAIGVVSERPIPITISTGQGSDLNDEDPTKDREESVASSPKNWPDEGASTDHTSTKAFSSTRQVQNFFDRDIHAVIASDQTVRTIHNNAEEFAPCTEEAFKYIQVFTAICDSFAHGANDVANAVGPFAAIYSLYRHGKVDEKSEVPIWCLAVGGVGIVAGLAIYGFNVIRAISVKLVKVSPSRGFAIELGAAAVVVLGSRYGIPLSTTHCQVGATVGVGLMEGGRGVNLALFVKVIAGWVLTLVVVGTAAAGLFAQGVYAPSVFNLRTIEQYQGDVGEFTANAGRFLQNGSIIEESNELIDKMYDVSEAQIDLLERTTRSLVMHIEECMS